MVYCYIISFNVREEIMKSASFAIIIGLASFTLSTSVLATDMDQQNKQAFKNAYSAFQEATKTGSRETQTSTALAAYEIGKNIYKSEPITLGLLAKNYGNLEEDPKKAIKALKHAVTLHESVYGPNSYKMADLLTELALAKIEKTNSFTRNNTLKRAKELIVSHKGEKSIEMAHFHMSVGKTAIKLGDLRAIKYFKKAKEIFDKSNDPSIGIEVATANFWIGRSYLEKKQYEQATEQLTASLETLSKASPNGQLTMANHAYLIQVYENQNLRDKATKHCQAIGKVTPVDANQDYLPIYRTSAEYPRYALDISQEGHAIINFTVDEEGLVQNPKISDFEGTTQFGHEAIKAVKKFRYIPRYQDNKPVKTHNVKYRFSYQIAS